MRYLILMLLFLQLVIVPSLCLADTDGWAGPPTQGAAGDSPAGAISTGASQDGVGAAGQSSKEKLESTPNGRLELRGESGDSEILLTWYVTEQGPGKPVSFVISYHGDLDKVEKKQEQIKKSPYRLRGLKNGQHYCVRVSGYSREGKEVVSSDELTLIPLSPDELSSPLERAFSAGLPKKPNGEKQLLKQFGYDFFSNSVAASPDNQPVGSDYVVGPGDALRIDVWGSVQARYDLVVDRNGEVLIPKVGAVKVWGLNYSQLRAVIDKAISRYYRGYELNVTLGKLRTIQVFVVGEVREPGSYTISSLATAINALSAAGGPTKNGSLRKVRLLRGGKTVQEMDLYAMFLSGDRSRDLRVENGDTLFVPLIGPVAAVAGEVKRPAIYELKGEKTLPMLLEMAGGITAAADNTRIQVERLEDNNARVILDYHPKTRNLDNQLSTVPIVDRDLVKVFPFYDHPRGMVTLKGNVARPGDYQFHEGMRLRDLIPDYSALLPETYLGAVEITRMQLPDRHVEKLSANLGEALAGDQSENVELREQDTVKVFSRWDMQEQAMVSVTGEVVKPGSYPFYPHMTVRDLLTAGGSLKRNALLGSAELTRTEVRGGLAVASRVNLDLQKVLAGDPAANLTLQPDDMLTVRSITNWMAVPDRFVTLKGEVRYPGMYSITYGERLSSVINRAGGFTERAYLRGARFTRRSVQEMQQKRMDEVIERSEQQILKKQSEASAVASSGEDMAATKSSLDSLLKNLEILKNKKAEGRIVINLLPPDQLARTSYDLELMGGDELEVPVTPSVVSVLGDVYNPTSFVYQRNETVAGYLQKSGGPLSDADPSETYIVRVDGSVTSRQQSSFGFRWDENDKSWHFGSFMSRTLNPGDTIVVPQNYDHIAWLREIKDLTTIVSQVALTAGTIFLYFK
ncbi:SLBB domain-containing protein [Geomonas sp.]|uniref:SLBB domain-containing protein n=1 Tax=Geomonas sp. TaxID=2651584 RepID=UPI002B45EA08|nr:SLBB domain-containing protein [Geomonas sp.]HJV36231.1 SLBB domain-containing protein [Geomonas sp.]